MQGIDHGLLIRQFRHPVILLKQSFELVHWHSKLRCLLKHGVQVRHQRLVLLLHGLPSLKFLILTGYFVIKLLKLHEEVVLDLNCPILQE